MDNLDLLTKKLIEAKNNKDIFAAQIIMTKLLQNISEDDISRIREIFDQQEEKATCIN